MQIENITNVERLETKVIKGERGSGTIAMNGAAARKVQHGDHVIIVSRASIYFDGAKTFKPSIVFPDQNNKI